MTAADVAVPDRDLGRVVEEMISGALGRAVTRFDRRPSEYRTSFPLEVLDVWLEDGARVEVVFKHLARDALTEDGRRAKPEFLFDPLREIETYRLILDPAGMGTPRFYGADLRRGWLFLEKVRGVELYQVGERSTWAEAARWAARMHVAFRGSVEDVAEGARLLRHDADFYRRWTERAAAFAGQDARAVLERLRARYDDVAEELASLEPTFIHGELYASNVIVDRGADGLRVAPVDWELAAVGPGPIDLAALTAGGWSEEDRRAIASAYAEEDPPADRAAFWRALELCRLHLAVQWLGWSPEWAPPPEHRHDWLAEASAAADGLGL